MSKNILTPWWKTFLTSILGTTISIALTFGTTAWVSNKKKQDAQRQTAMMVIHDIDVSAALMEKKANLEEKSKNAVQYIMDHFSQIDSLPEDTLWYAMAMISLSSDETIFDDSKEKIFNSSQDTWSNLDNVAFVDNMERFYQSRRHIQVLFANSPQWKEPVSQSDFNDMMLHYSVNGKLNISEVLKQKLRDPKIKLFIDYSSSRIRTLYQYAQHWKDLSDRNKFIMNIDDDELAEYVKKSQKSGRKVGKSELIGQWELSKTGTEAAYYDFVKPDSFCVKKKCYIANPFYSGNIVLTFNYGGKWYIEGDSLMLEYSSKNANVEVDRSNITYRPEMQDSVDSFINRHYQANKLTEELRKNLDLKDTLGVSINKSSDKIEWIRRLENSGHKTEVTSCYLKRIKNPKSNKTNAIKKEE